MNNSRSILNSRQFLAAMFGVAGKKREISVFTTIFRHLQKFRHTAIRQHPIFIINSGLAIGLTTLSASAADLTPFTHVLAGEAVAVTYETNGSIQTTTSNEVFVHIQPSQPPTVPTVAQPTEVQDALTTLDAP